MLTFNSKGTTWAWLIKAMKIIFVQDEQAVAAHVIMSADTGQGSFEKKGQRNLVEAEPHIHIIVIDSKSFK